jgi:hypothetical protein
MRVAECRDQGIDALPRMAWWWRVARPRDMLFARDSGAERAIAVAYLISHAVSKMRAAMASGSWLDCFRQLNSPIPGELEVTGEKTALFASGFNRQPRWSTSERAW